VGLTDQAVQKIVDALHPLLSDNARPVAEPQAPPPGPAPGRRVFDSYSEAAQVAQAQDEPLLVSFWMEGCAPCFQLKTIKADPEVSEFLGTNYVVANVNVRTDPATTQQFGVRTVPTEIVRYRSREIGRHGVLGSKQSYLSWHRTVLRRRTGISPR
jgi:thiol-disulfide isomerase/thioredoxin